MRNVIKLFTREGKTKYCNLIGTRLYYGFFWNTKKVNLADELIDVRVVGQESNQNKSFVGSAIGGAVGGALLGPVGMLSGALSFGNSVKNKMSVVGVLRNGEQFLIEDCDYGTMNFLQSYAFSNQVRYSINQGVSV